MSDGNNRGDQGHVENESRERGLEERREKVRGTANGFESEPERVGGVGGGWFEREEMEFKEGDLGKSGSEAREEV